MKFGDFLSEDDKKRLWRQTFEPFQVYRLKANLPGRDYKLCLLVCLSPCSFYYINTNVHKKIEVDPDKNSLQVVLYGELNEFLTEEVSHIDCSYLVDSMINPNMIGDMLNGHGKYMGKIDDDAQKQVMEAIQNSKFLSPKQKKAILSYLSEG